MEMKNIIDLKDGRNINIKEKLKIKYLKVKEGLNEVNQINNITSPPIDYSNEYDEELYNQINEENRQVAKFLETLFKKKKKRKNLKSIKEIEKLLNDSLTETINSMYRKYKIFIYNESKKKNNKNDYDIYLDLKELTSDERKLLMISYNINIQPLYKENILALLLRKK